MALAGTGQEYDYSFVANDNLKTSTSQYMTVAMTWDTTTADYTVQACANSGTGTLTISSHCAIGVCQEKLSSGSNNVTIRLHGISKVLASESIAAGDPIEAYAGATANAYIGAVQVCDALATTNTVARVCLGRALEDADAGEYISAYIIHNFMPIQ